jgi:hypothetical protein
VSDVARGLKPRASGHFNHNRALPARVLYLVATGVIVTTWCSIGRRGASPRRFRRKPDAVGIRMICLITPGINPDVTDSYVTSIGQYVHESTSWLRGATAVEAVAILNISGTRFQPPNPVERTGEHGCAPGRTSVKC